MTAGHFWITSMNWRVQRSANDMNTDTSDAVMSITFECARTIREDIHGQFVKFGRCQIGQQRNCKFAMKTFVVLKQCAFKLNRSGNGYVLKYREAGASSLQSVIQIKGMML